MTTRRTFDRGDLLDAYLKARHYAHAGGELVDYHGRRYAALADAFAARLDQPPKAHDFRPAWFRAGDFSEFGDRAYDAWSDAQEALLDLFEQSLARLEGVTSPFAGYLEAPIPVIAYHRRFAEEVAARCEGLRTVLRAMLDDLVQTIWDFPNDRYVDAEELRKHGFDASEPEPDPLNDW